MIGGVTVYWVVSAVTLPPVLSSEMKSSMPRVLVVVPESMNWSAKVVGMA